MRKTTTNLAHLRIENSHLTHSRQIIYIALEELNFLWDEKEVIEFDQMWKRGVSLKRMARYFNREEDEVAMLILDRKRKKRISVRDRGLHESRSLI
ncbi:helix-turn-helix domain containing protein [Bacillus solitudinis]|uniref:helix-turn-helix domain containing protein n=1 Tax=Bacillus solitudinis TaxID=2014074 RepID=UPI001D0D04B2|nr:helix-turn-helix domain containing protein [Bacillus solitudinis]